MKRKIRGLRALFHVLVVSILVLTQGCAPGEVFTGLLQAWNGLRGTGATSTSTNTTGALNTNVATGLSSNTNSNSSSTGITLPAVNQNVGGAVSLPAQ